MSADAINAALQDGTYVTEAMMNTALQRSVLVKNTLMFAPVCLHVSVSSPALYPWPTCAYVRHL